ncbi:hypothetical protein [Micromonospora fulviviridis]|uniref:DUF2510 domain-containing protein n=1 Tax=Micromonospora fulviviridis TaxID=47860 RepID=A0ABV2VDM8_9ACTN
MGLRWSVPLPGPFSVGGRIGGGRRGKKGGGGIFGLILLAATLCCAGSAIVNAFDDGGQPASAPSPTEVASARPVPTPTPLAASRAVMGAGCLPPAAYPWDPTLPVVDGLRCTWDGKQWRWAAATASQPPPPTWEGGAPSSAVSEQPGEPDEPDDDGGPIRGVTPGAYCAHSGATGYTDAGTRMVCRGPGRERWRRPL